MSGAPTDIAFWRNKYRSGHTPWDLGGVSRPVLDLLERWGPTRARILVPGCGRGYEALYLAAHGHQVTAVDVVTEPLDELRAVAAARGLEPEALRIVQSDVFDLPSSWDGTFDGILEQTCLCALHPDNHPAYESLLYRLLVPGGQVMGVFMETGRPGGPPFDTPPAHVWALFPAARWDREGPIAVRPQNPARPGPEFLARFVRRPPTGSPQELDILPEARSGSDAGDG